MQPQSSSLPDLLEQAHRALLRGNLPYAQELLDRLTAVEPNNAEAQSLRAMLITRQAAADEQTRLQTGIYPSAMPPYQTGSKWTRPIADPVRQLLNSQSAQRRPKPLLLLACLGAGVQPSFIPFSHHHYYGGYGTSWRENIVFGLIFGFVLFFWILLKRR